MSATRIAPAIMVVAPRFTLRQQPTLVTNLESLTKQAGHQVEASVSAVADQTVSSAVALAGAMARRIIERSRPDACARACTPAVLAHRVKQAIVVLNRCGQLQRQRWLGRSTRPVRNSAAISPGSHGRPMRCPADHDAIGPGRGEALSGHLSAS
jgi:hypothetical protein